MFRLFICLPIVLYFMEFGLQTAGVTIIDTQYIQIYILGAMLFYLVREGKGVVKIFKQYSYLYWLLLFLVIYSGYYVYQLYSFTPLLDSFALTRVYGGTLFWTTTLVAFTQAVRSGRLQIEDLKIFSRVLFVTSILVIFVEVFLGSRISPEINTVTGYIILMVLPLMLFSYPEKSFYLIITTILVCLISGKRGAILISIVVFSYYLLFNRNFKTRASNRKLSNVFLVLVVIGLAYFFYEYAYGSIMIRVSELYESPETAGSGRSIFWMLVLEKWMSADLANQIFGFGFYSTSTTLDKMYGMSIQAHNDYLELLHTLGLVGLIFFIFFQTGLWKTIRKHVTNKRIKFCAYTALIVFIGFSFFAGALYRPYTVLLVISVGSLLGYTIKKK